MIKVLQILVAALGVMFSFMGLRWVFDPSGAAASFEVELLGGLALSNQISVIGTFFLATGGMMLYGIVKGKSIWLYPSALVIFLAAVLRVLAWMFQGAPFTTGFIAIELVFTALLLFAASKFAQAE